MKLGLGAFLDVYHYLRRQFLTKRRVYIFEQMCQLVAMWLGSSEKLIGLELSAGTTNLHVYPISLAWHVISGQKIQWFFFKRHLHFLYGLDSNFCLRKAGRNLRTCKNCLKLCCLSFNNFIMVHYFRLNLRFYRIFNFL